VQQTSKRQPAPCLYTLPTSVSFTGKGFLGYTFGPLSQKDLEVSYVEVEKGQDTFVVSRKIVRTYYVVSGAGYFTIANQKYDVGPGMLVEVPPGVEYSYSGRMTLIVLSKPRWFSGSDTHTRWNPDVVRQDSPCGGGRGSWQKQLVRAKMFGKSPARLYLRLNERLWKLLPSFFTSLGPMRSYGSFLNILARMQEVRAQALSTYFLRNRPELELIRRLLDSKSHGETLRVAVLGCSTGAEAYSVAWSIRSARPDLRLILHAVDISKQAVEFGKQGIYSLKSSELTDTKIFDRMTMSEMDEMFDRQGEVAAVKSWIKEGMNWLVADAGEPEILDVLGSHDMVVANNFLCHMEPWDAERSLRNIARLVRPEGLLFVSGIDLDVRTKVALELEWDPVQELLEEIHDGDPSCKNYWPCHYAGLEPLNKRRRHWRVRYAAAFRMVPAATTVVDRSESMLVAADSGQ
jgi:chemotaxis methyl-accepting protein methylase/mannose-6-phosphate isomerase-like protein (cupin superfamily)